MKQTKAWLAIGLCALLAGCFSDTGPLDSSAGTQTVHMATSTFTPSSVNISRGGSVKWVNDGAVAHDITPNNASQGGTWTAHKVAASSGASFTFQFTATGTYDYHCTVHSGMTGRITVN